MKKKSFVLSIFLLIAFLFGCSENNSSSVEVIFNGEVKTISNDVFSLFSNKNAPPLKSAISPSEIGDIEISSNNITYKIFQRENTFIVYFNDGDIFQYEISIIDFNKIKNSLK